MCDNLERFANMCANIARDLKTIQNNGHPSVTAVGASYDESAKYAGVAQRSASSRCKKSANAFRTISEVADELGVKQHVLRFWETKFSQLKPLKRGGGRRYYRPEDIDLLRAVHRLLYTEGYTIKGVQKLLREAGKKQIITAFSGDSGDGRSRIARDDKTDKRQFGSASGLTPEQRASLEAVLAELKELRGMIKTHR